MTIPLTPTGSPAEPHTSASPATANLDKELPSTPTKAHTAKAFSPSSGGKKKHSPIMVRIPTPTSPTLEAGKGKKSVRKVIQAGKGSMEEKEEDEGKSLLNPHSSTFKPQSTLESFSATMRDLSLNDAGPSSRPLQIITEKEGPETPKKKKDASHFGTPRQPIRGETLASTPSLTYTPFAPSTSQSSRLPITPSTPATPVRRGNDNSLEGKNQKERQMQMVSGMGEDLPEDIGRYLLIQQIPRDATEEEIKSLIESTCNFKAIIIKLLRSRGFVIVAFYDPREATKLYNILRTSSVRFRKEGPSIQLHCMKTEFTVVQSIIGRSAGWEKIWEDSHSIIKVEITGGVGVSREIMDKTLTTFGELQRLDEVGNTGRCFIAEYFDTRHATAAIESLNGQKAQQALISVSYLNPNLGQPSAPATLSNYTLGTAAYFPGRLGQSRASSRGQTTSIASSDVFGYTTSTEASSPLHTPRTAPFSRVRSESDVFDSRKSSSIYSTASQSRQASGYSTPQKSWARNSAVESHSGYETPPHLLALSRRLHEPGTVEGLVNNADIEARARQGQGLGGHWNLNDRKAIPAHNRVFPERILTGLDPRTTVMIKDVPNKLSRQELIDILEEVVPGDYDFVYLRFDFKNCCNVGYAFVNFCSVKALYQFIQAKVGKKWNMFSSEKVLQVSYADIQGKAALINKFKNSAVMGVIEAWRPQIFYSNGRMKGQPEPFPDVGHTPLQYLGIPIVDDGPSYPYGYEDQYYDYTSPHGSTYGV
uniref:RRM domain-containing protein n=1 Tax=Kwoniella bestiolae CBS 10118 TaxID=1296100 RepID=A0A1B9FSG9_9TREE|nr:hypothetical protein I302_08496 [Kwoniella bestiolae CBS 10118]OCF21719.1 hypothetical protein I302_08496 [Kwoniella bestiolae CBS 10118]